MGQIEEQYIQHSGEVNPHVTRVKQILAKHPEISKLMGRNPNTFLFILLLVGIQVGMLFTIDALGEIAAVGNYKWLIMVVVAYTVGAFCNHGLFVLTHECTHNLVFKKRIFNVWAGILCDLPNGFPTAIGFRRFHIKHHSHQGHYYHDADIANLWEAKLIGNVWWRKALWLAFFPIFQLTRPPRIREMKVVEKWTWINFFTVLAIDILVVWAFGWIGLVYLVLSLFFSIGLHPLGARWIQEHYVLNPPQETYDYYGWVNKIQFNIGYHNEHHDFPSVPWNNLPKIRAMAPEFYDTLYYHKSWSALLLRFIFDKNLSLYSRSLRTIEATQANAA